MFYKQDRIRELSDKEYQFWEKHKNDAEPPALSGKKEFNILLIYFYRFIICFINFLCHVLLHG